jgi:1-acyl-sn-glycerol-3-phosphate acyltransferase
MYRLLKFLIGIGIRLYYREIHVKNLRALSCSEPFIIVANHPNTLIDAWIVALYAKRKTYYLTKGTFFNSPLKNWFLRRLHMIPINRNREEKIHGVNNSDSFEACYEVLENGNCLVIFPEGNSIMERLLRELKTGTARIALQTEFQNRGLLGLRIVPLGLFYTEGDRFRSAIHVEFGESLRVKDYLALYQDNKTAGIKTLTADIRNRMEDILLPPADKEEEMLVNKMIRLLSFGKRSKSVQNIFDHFRRLQSLLIMLRQNSEERISLTRKVEELYNKLTVHTPVFFSQGPMYLPKTSRTEMFWHAMVFIIASPLMLFGIINNILPFKLTGWSVPKMVKNREFYAPVAILFGLLAYPIQYGISTYLFSILYAANSWQMILYFLFLPISGMISFYLFRNFYIWYQQFRQQRYKKEKQSTLNEILAERDLLTRQIDEMINAGLSTSRPRR